MTSEKRDASVLDEPGEATTTQKRTRQKREITKTASSERPNRILDKKLNQPRSLRSSFSSSGSPPKVGKPAKKVSRKGPGRPPASSSGKPRGRPRLSKPEATSPDEEVKVDDSTTKSSRKTKGVTRESPDVSQVDGPQYWLMKAEPESRIEKGKDVKFSIDDLKSAAEPEAWDGVRNYVARNNMRSMIKGDQAFFYHSNCKVPGIVGIMEIVQEHSVDESAFDPDHPYHDEKSKRDNPKWCVVHVKFVRKFSKLVPLKELQKFAKSGGTLEHMQVIKQSRLSVSKVSKEEWDFVMGLVAEEEAEDAKAHEPAVTD